MLPSRYGSPLSARVSQGGTIIEVSTLSPSLQSVELFAGEHRFFSRPRAKEIRERRIAYLHTRRRPRPTGHVFLRPPTVTFLFRHHVTPAAAFPATQCTGHRSCCSWIPFTAYRKAASPELSHYTLLFITTPTTNHQRALRAKYGRRGARARARAQSAAARCVRRAQGATPRHATTNAPRTPTSTNDGEIIQPTPCLSSKTVTKQTHVMPTMLLTTTTTTHHLSPIIIYMDEKTMSPHVLPCPFIRPQTANFPTSAARCWVLMPNL